MRNRFFKFGEHKLPDEEARRTYCVTSDLVIYVYEQRILIHVHAT